MRLCSLQAGEYAFSNALTLELRNRAEDVHLELPCWRGCINSFREAHEGDAERLAFVEQRDQVSEIAPKAIEPPADQHVKLTPSSRLE